MSRRHHRLDARLWRRTRRAVFDRDRWRCVGCGRAGRLECDHIRPLSRFPDQDPYDLEGCQTLCRSCHVAKSLSERRRPEPPAELSAWHRLVDEMLRSPPAAVHTACSPSWDGAPGIGTVRGIQ